MDENTWDNWVISWNWILNMSANHNWKTQPLVIKKRLDGLLFDKLENELQVKYPVDFKEILTNFSSGVHFSWTMFDEGKEQVLPEEFRAIFGGCGACRDGEIYNCLWEFENLSKLYKTYQGWLTDCFNDPADWYGKHYYHKVPFIEVPNGDFIAFDTKGQVVYLSHDDGSLHGEKLADNFIEFISLWSNLGCIGTESEQFAVFYDGDEQKLMSIDPKIDRWKQWLTQ